MSGSPRESNRTLVLLVAVLAVALVAVMFLWMQDRESKDVEVELGSRALESQEAVGWESRTLDVRPSSAWSPGAAPSWSRRPESRFG